MAKKKPLFMVGIFVIIGTLIGVGTIVWLGASRYFQKGTTYVTYFDESVQGLQTDSRVKYQGVEIGWVKKIGMAPDFKLIEVVMKIDFEGDIEHKAVAKLEMAGITGMVFVGLESKKPSHEKLSPRIDFPTPYPVIPSIPSDVQQIFSKINEVVVKAGQIDFKGISDQIKATTRAMETFLADDDMRSMRSSLVKVAANLESVSERINTFMEEDGEIEEILAEAKGVVGDARTAIAKVKHDLNAINLGETVTKANQLLDGIAKKKDVIATEIQVTSENLRRVTESL